MTITHAPRARIVGTVGRIPHFARIDPATGRILSVSGSSLSAELRASLGFVPIPPEHADDFHANPVDRTWIDGKIGRCAALPLRLLSAFKTRRAALLSASDYLMGADAPPIAADKLAAWKTYRQALRDIPKQPGFPQKITWPTPPAS